MKTLEINISIPLADNATFDASKILELIADTLDERFNEIDGYHSDDTLADIHGFGGNTITLSTGSHVEEICL